MYRQCQEHRELRRELCCGFLNQSDRYIFILPNLRTLIAKHAVTRSLFELAFR